MLSMVSADYLRTSLSFKVSQTHRKGKKEPRSRNKHIFGISVLSATTNNWSINSLLTRQSSCTQPVAITFQLSFLPLVFLPNFTNSTISSSILMNSDRKAPSFKPSGLQLCTKTTTTSTYYTPSSSHFCNSLLIRCPAKNKRTPSGFH